MYGMGLETLTPALLQQLSELPPGPPPAPGSLTSDDGGEPPPSTAHGSQRAPRDGSGAAAAAAGAREGAGGGGGGMCGRGRCSACRLPLRVGSQVRSVPVCARVRVPLS
jgi:hypothetical protein